MLQKAQPLPQQVDLEHNTFIVSQADSQGKIIYVNQDLMRISGYSENELLGFDHNILRHPDMPKAIFKLLWTTIQDGHEFNGYIKNMCKNGEFYWVYATVIKSMCNNATIYSSIRKKPSEKALRALKPIYSAMKEAEKKHPDDKNLTESLHILTQEYDPFGMTYDEYVLSF